MRQDRIRRRSGRAKMPLLQRAVEKRLSKLLGAAVRFEKFSVSPFKGIIEIVGIRVGDDEEAPILTVARVRAEMSVKRALGGEIVVKSVTIERPVLSVIRWGDGTTNLPSRPGAEADEKPGSEGEDKTSW